MSMVYKSKSVILAAAIFFTFVFIIVLYSNTTSYRISPSAIQRFSNKNLNQTSPQLPRVLCLILTNPKYFPTRVVAVNKTWAPRCDGYYFISEPSADKDPNSAEVEISKKLPIAPIKNITAGYEHLTQKSVLAFLFAYEHHFNDFDWFIKADDDTYLFVDNLRTFLSDKNSSDPVTFGYNFKVIVSKGYHSGGGSYVLSRESLRRFYEAHQDPKSGCRKDGGAEDAEVAKCLRTKGVYPGRSLDAQNRELFHPLSFYDHFHGNFPDWLRQYAENSLRTVSDLLQMKCSTDFILFVEL